MRKFLQLISLLSPEGLGFRMIEAAEAFENPAHTRAARRYGAVAVVSLLAGSLLLVAAALVDTFANARPLSEKIGLAGIVCLVVCVYCGLRYKEANQSTAKETAAQPENPNDVNISK